MDWISKNKFVPNIESFCGYIMLPVIIKVDTSTLTRLLGNWQLFVFVILISLPPQTPAFIRQVRNIMGGCAGKFKGSDDLPPEPLPTEAPVNPGQAEGETVAQVC